MSIAEHYMLYMCFILFTNEKKKNYRSLYCSLQFIKITVD